MTLIQQYRLDEATRYRAKLDFKDEKILGLLAENARARISAIAKQVYLSKEVTFYRIERLKKTGIIMAFIPIFDLRAFGYYTYHVFMVINEVNLERRQEFIDYLIEHPSTKGIMEYSDRWDIEWILIAKDVQDFDDIITDVMRIFSDIVMEKNKLEIILGYKSIQLPYESKKEIILKPIEHNRKFDARDFEICKILTEDARQSTPQIGQKVRLSPDAVQYRLKNLTKSEIIRQFTILPNFSLLGYHWQTLCIDVKMLDLSHEMKLKEYISTKPQIIRAVKTLGNWDLMLHIVTKEVEELHKVVKDIQKSFADIIISYQAWGGYKEHFFTCLPKVVGNVFK